MNHNRRHVLLAMATVVCCGLLLSAGAAHARPTSESLNAPSLRGPLFTEVPTWAGAPDFRDAPWVRRHRFVRVDLAQLRDPDTHQTLTLNLFPDAVVTASRHRVEPATSRGFTWYGHTEIEGSWALITTIGDVAVADVRVGDGRLYSLKYVRDGIHVITDIDDDAQPTLDTHVDPETGTTETSGHTGAPARPLTPTARSGAAASGARTTHDDGHATHAHPAPQAYVHTHPDGQTHSHTAEPGHTHAPESSVVADAAPERPAIPAQSDGLAAADCSNFDVMVVYTDDARAAAGDTDAMVAEVYNAVATVNQAFVNSLVDVQLSLVHVAEVDYAETGNLSTDLSRLKNKSDGQLDAVHTWRDTYGADLVSMWTETGGGGIAYVMDTVGNSFESNAFSVLDRGGASSSLVFAHELGHNFGSHHDWFEEGIKSAPTYRMAHISIPGEFRTILGYNTRCIAQLGHGCLRIPFWSNPSVSYMGHPTGIAEGTSSACLKGVVPTTECDADNAKRFANTRCTIAGFRPTASKNADVWMKDTWKDSGEEPDPLTAGQDMWKSPYIWIRGAADPQRQFQHQHQNPENGAVNYVYTKLHNDSATPQSGTLKLYWAHASTGLNWNPAANGAPLWHEFASIPLTLPAQGSLVAETTWTPAADQVGHYCLIARWVSTGDPMTHAEGTNIGVNVRNNNNIVWRNVNIVDLLAGDCGPTPTPTASTGGTPTPTPPGTQGPNLVYDGNPCTGQANGSAMNVDAAGTRQFNLVFRVPPEERAAFPERNEVMVHLGPDLADAWRGAGGRGTGFQAVANRQLRMTAPREMRLEGIPMVAQRPYPFSVALTAREVVTQAKAYKFEAVQIPIDSNTPLGGILYEVNLVPPDTEYAVLRGMVYMDGNVNGSNGTDVDPDPADLPIRGHEVHIIDAGNTVRKVKSDPNGRWEARVAPGRYRVGPGDLRDYDLTDPYCGDYVVTVKKGNEIDELDFGLIEANTPGIPRLCLSPPNAVTTVSGATPVEIRVFNVSNVYAGQLTLDYDEALIEFVDMDAARPGAQILKGAFLTPFKELVNVADTAQGVFRYAFTLEGAVNGESGDGTLGVMLLRGRSDYAGTLPATSPLRFDRVVFSDPQSVEIPIPARNGRITVIGVNKPKEPTFNLKGRVILERRNGNAEARVCVEANCTTTDGAGDWRLENVQNGQTLSVRHISYLRSERPIDFPNAKPGDTVDVPTVKLIAGDLNQDDVVEAEDMATAGRNLDLVLNPANPNPQWEPAADITNNNAVNVLDTTGVYFNVWRTAPMPWSETPVLGGRPIDRASIGGTAAGAGPALRAARATGAQAGATIKLQPSAARGSVGGEVPVDIVVEDVDDLYAFTMALTFDPAVVRVKDANPNDAPVQIRIGEFLDPINQQVVFNEVDNAAGRIAFAMTQQRPAVGKSGAGVLGTIVFEGKAPGKSPIAFERYRLANNARPVSLQIPATASPGEIEIGGDGFLKNISTRSYVDVGDKIMIGGFIIEDGPAKVMIRALGPSLPAEHVPNRLADPRVRLIRMSDTAEIAANDNWADSPRQAEIAADPLRPTDPREAVILVELPKGAYTALVDGVGGATGIGLVEVFWVSGEGRLKNISTRAGVRLGDEVMIGGFIVRDGPTEVAIRALGPSLPPEHVPDRLMNPTLQLYGGSTLLMENDDWGQAPNAGVIGADPLRPRSPSEAMIITTLQPGPYTAIVRGVGGTTGIGLIEVFKRTAANTPGLFGALERLDRGWRAPAPAGRIGSH